VSVRACSRPPPYPPLIPRTTANSHRSGRPPTRPYLRESAGAAQPPSSSTLPLPSRHTPPLTNGADRGVLAAHAPSSRTTDPYPVGVSPKLSHLTSAKRPHTIRRSVHPQMRLSCTISSTKRSSSSASRRCSSSWGSPPGGASPSCC